MTPVTVAREADDTGGASALRVLFVSHTFPPQDRTLESIGGMQRVAVELHHALLDCPDVQLRSYILRTPWRWIYFKTPAFIARICPSVLNLARTGRFDVVLFSSVLAAGLMLPFLSRIRRHGVKVAAIAHGDDVLWPHWLYQSMIRRVLRRLDLVVSVSWATGMACGERGLTRDRLRVIPNGINVDRFASLEDGRDRLSADRFLVEYCGAELAPEDAFLLCSVGRQVPRKGFAWFVEHVMPALPENIHYCLAGSGPEAEHILAAVENGRLNHRVHLLGSISERDLLTMYRSADLFIMPNVRLPGTMEGFGVVMLEAGLCGLPAIAARLEGIRDVIREGTNGHLVKSGNAPAFVRAITRYLHKPARLEKLARRTRRYSREFAWPTIVRRYVSALRSISDTATTQATAKATHSAKIRTYE